MNNIILYNPSIGTSNIGDRIIFKYAKRALMPMFKNQAFIEFPTQMPVSKKLLKRFFAPQHAFVCGSNLLQANMFLGLCRRGITTHGIRQWDISWSIAKKIAPVILLGCGWQNYNKKINLYTKCLWRRLLNANYIHSVRDEFTYKMLQSIGIKNVINTGCPTTWALTPDFCKKIPTSKAKSVVATITDYRRDLKKDEQMIEILIENYDKVWLWLQGIEDEEYFKTFSNKIQDKVQLIAPQLEAYHEVLMNNNIDYVGTRLHGGIYALNQKKRTIIIGIDNRALEMKRDINLKVLKREEIDCLAEQINCNFATEITLKQENINLFLNQFEYIK